MPGCLVYAGEGWSRGDPAHARGVAARGVLPAGGGSAAMHSPETRELDHVLAATFGLWELVLPASRRFTL